MKNRSILIPKIYKKHFLRLFLALSILLTGTSLPAIAEDNEDGWELPIGVNAYYDYTHPGQVNLNVNFITEIFHDGFPATEEQLDFVSVIYLDLIFLVEGEVYNWDPERINLGYGHAGASVTQESFNYDGQTVDGVTLTISDAIAFAEEVREWSEIGQQGVPVAIVEAFPTTIQVFGEDACNYEDFTYYDCKTVTAEIIGAEIVLQNGVTPDISGYGNSSTPCELNVEFYCEFGFPVDEGAEGDNGGFKNNSSNNFLPESTVSVFPNPAENAVNIHVPKGNDRIESIEIFDNTGVIVYVSNSELPTNRKTIDLSHFSSGIYFTRITTETGSILKKLIIH